MINYIKIDAGSSVPKYRQLINSFQEAIEGKVLIKGQKIPSINELSTTFKLSRDTILTAFYELQAKGVITPKAGKGFYINNNKVTQEHKVFLLFDTLSAYKEQLLTAFKTEFSRKGSIDVHFHYFNTKVFESLIRESIGNYTAYVIMPIPSKTVAPVIESIPQDKLYILDRGRRMFGHTYPSVCQSFRKDVYNSLSSGDHLIKKYKKLTLIFPDDGRAPMDLKRGFVQFCTEFNYEYAVTSRTDLEISHGEAYLAIDDSTLVNLVKQANELKYLLGKDIGIISYNDTPLKSIAANGITTISTDFSEMGRSMANLVINRQRQHIDNPCRLIVRQSL
ncbi:MAG TPA: GntR family transcriptional regulator [Puia sp.]|nr:GntR family transcriptional regulator [Puia sp.]